MRRCARPAHQCINMSISRSERSTHVELVVLRVEPDVRFDRECAVREGGIDRHVPPVVVVGVNASL